MAHLWISSPGAWSAHPLGDQQHIAPTGCGSFAAHSEPTHSSIHLVRARTDAGEFWALLAADAHRVRVNGSRMVGGLRVLKDRDEISLGELGCFYFATESLAKVESFTGEAEAVHCPRCKQAVDTGTDVVRCPWCHVVYHSSTDLPCWQYSECCALCGQLTDLDAGFRWAPEGT